MISTEPMIRLNFLKNMHQTQIENNECLNLLGSRRNVLMSSHFCALDRENDASGCIYDQGAGFIVTEDGINYVVGVLSLVTHMCRPQFPNMYTRVSDYTDWIQDTLDLWDAN